VPSLDISFIIGLAGTLGTIIFGIISLLYTFKFQKKTDICIANLGTTSLFSSITNGIDGLTIEYKNMSVSDTLLLIKAAIINIGNEDIAKTMIYENLQISPGEGYDILNTAVTDEAHGVNSSINHTPKIINITWELLKQGEYIVINILAKKTTKDSKSVNLETKCRIQGVKEITHQNKPTQSKISKIIDEILFIIVMTVMASVLLSSSIIRTKTYMIADKDSSISSVTIRTKLNNIDIVLVNDKKINLDSINDIKINGVSLEDLCKKTIHDNSENKNVGNISLIFALVMISIPTYLSIKNIRSFFKNRKYSKLFPPHLLN